MTTQERLFDEAETFYPDKEDISGDAPPAIASIPWVAVALAVHVIMLVIAWFIIPQPVSRPPMIIMDTTMDPVAEPPVPEQPPEKQVEFPNEDVSKEEPVEDQRLATEESDHAEDQSDSPNRDLAENPNENESEAESPHPDRNNPNSSLGLKGGGGGGGPGGDGGMFRHRPKRGGGVPIERKEPIDAALKWLADHQNREGYWSATNFAEDSSRVGAENTHNIDFVKVNDPEGDQGWEATCDVGLTGLAILAFTGMGYDHKATEYGRTLRQAVLYLMRVQDPDGCFGGRDDDHFIYNHAIATMAMAELYFVSQDMKLKPICDRAVGFIMKAQNPTSGWRYGVQPADNDTSVTGWMVLTLHVCEAARLEFDKSQCYDSAAAWFELVTAETDGYLKVGYNSPGSDCSRLRSTRDLYDVNPSMDAIYVMSMLFMRKRDVSDRDIRSLTKVCVEKEYLPRWEQSKIDYYYWYYASQALHQVGDSHWEQWSKAMFKTLTDHQRGWHQKDKDAGRTSAEMLDEHGSWDPIGAWGTAGGRVYSTAINALTLQVWHRYERMNK